MHGTVYEFTRNSALDARNFFDQGSIPDFQRNVFGGSLGGPIKKDKIFIFGNYEGFRQNLGLSDVTLVPDDASRASAVASVQPLLALWPVANGPEILTSSGAPSGIAKAFSNPTQNIREDFGTSRFDQTFSNTDSFSGVYTVDDSEAHTPTSNPFTLVDISLREQVASLSETHIFSSSLLNKATFGYSRGAFYFNSGTTTDLPGWIHDGQPVGAVVVGGGTTLNGASQITNGGTNAGSNLTRGAQPVYHFRSVHLHPREARAQLRRPGAADPGQRQPGAGSVRPDFVHQLADVPSGQSEHVHLCADVYAAVVAIDAGRLLRGRRDQGEFIAGVADRISRRIDEWLERGSGPRVQLRV